MADFGVTVADVKTYIGGIDATSDDDLIEGLINDAAAFIGRQTHRQFEAASATRYFDALADVQGPTLYLDEDLLSVTTITNGDSVVVASDEYVLLPTNLSPKYAIRLLASGGKSWTYDTDHEEAISILGNWGYATTVPADVAEACKLLAAYKYRARQAGPDADRTVIANGIVIAPSRIPGMVEELIKPYRKVLL